MDESCSTMSWYCMKAECCGRVLWRTISASLEARLRPRHMTPSTSSSTGRGMTGEWPRERSRTPACAKPLGTCRRCEKGRCSNTPTPIRIGGIGRELLPTMVWGMVCMAVMQGLCARYALRCSRIPRWRCCASRCWRWRMLLDAYTDFAPTEICMAVMQGLCARYALRCSRIPRWRCCASRCWRWRMLLDAYTDFAPTEIDGCGITETLPAYQWAVGALDRRLSTVEEGAGPAFAPQDAARISRAISDARGMPGASHEAGGLMALWCKAHHAWFAGIALLVAVTAELCFGGLLIGRAVPVGGPPDLAATARGARIGHRHGMDAGTPRAPHRMTT